jgi:hypothetical protein
LEEDFSKRVGSQNGMKDGDEKKTGYGRYKKVTIYCKKKAKG